MAEPMWFPSGLTIRHFRLASGQILWTYIAWHFINHALGLISLGAAETGLKIAAGVWQSWPGTVALYGAFFVHLTLALTGLHQRHTLLLPPSEILRIIFGLTIPRLLNISGWSRTSRAMATPAGNSRCSLRAGCMAAWV